MREPGRQSVTDFALPESAAAATGRQPQSRIYRHLQTTDTLFGYLTLLTAVLVLVILSGVILSLFIGAMPALRAFGFDFLFDQRWNPVTEKFGAFAAIYGTLVTAVIAMLMAVPLGLLIALFLTELCPMWLRRPIG